MDARPDAMPDGPPACVPGIINLCVENAEARTLTVSDAMNFDTGGGGCTKVLTQQGGPDICLVFVNRIEITSTGTLTAFGPRALALAAKEQLIVDGRIDASARRDPMRTGAGSLADTAAACAFATAPEPEEHGGAGGGAGGSYGTQGGAGGTGDLDMSTPDDGNGAGGTPGQAAAFSILRGGCPGQQGAQNSGAGRGGAGGGALYLSSPIIRINGTGSVLAAGAGGTHGDATNNGGGGGGGGSGGLIIMQGANVTVTGTLRATGGGGGQGGSNASLGEAGQDGAEPTGTNAALGGDQQVNGGNGGNGGASAGPTAGDDDNFAGGGGGGGNGIIRILSAAATLTGAQIAPTATVVP